MKTIPGALLTLLNAGGPYRVADLYEFTLFSGTILRWTSADYNITYGGNTYLTAGPAIARGPVREVAGLAFDTLEVTLDVGDAGVTLGGIGLVQAARQGAFDGARLVLYRAFMPDFGDVSAGVITRFAGEVGNVRPASTRVVLEVASDLQRLQVKLPRNLITPMCSHVLFDAGCGLVRATYAVAGTATGGSTVSSINSALAQAAGYFNLGVVVITSGAATGARRAVDQFAGGTFALKTALPAGFGAGDTFTAYPGCDKSSATCLAKYANLTRFRGFPYVPRAENAR